MKIAVTSANCQTSNLQNHKRQFYSYTMNHSQLLMLRNIYNNLCDVILFLPHLTLSPKQEK
jgi:hypothetical protein